MSEPHDRLCEAFRARVTAGDLPPAAHGLTASAVGLSRVALAHLLESQLMSRHLDVAARRLGKQKRGYYSIGSSGHEGNAAVARALRPTDMAFLHYRSAAFLIERQRQKDGSTPLWDMALSFVAAAEDPVSGGRHKVLGSHDLMVPPQTSTIASHLPKAMGAAFAIALARTHKKADAVMPHDAVAIASFGDASSNHSTTTGAINAAAWAAYQNRPLPLIFLCEDNGIGISVPTPDGWVRANYEGRAGLHYIAGDGTEVLDAWRAATQAATHARHRRAPVFLHLKAVRLMGHAGSDAEAAYRDRNAIQAAEAADPLLKTARTVIAEGVMSADDVLALDTQISARVTRVTEEACTRPKLTTADEVMRSITPSNLSSSSFRGQKSAKPPIEPGTTAEARRTKLFAADARALETPQHMSRLISLALADLMLADPSTVVFGEDVGKKGGVYGATVRLQEKFGPSRVFDTLLDEQSILGLAIGLAHNGYIPMPEIQFLAYVHNAEDQIRGEAATLSFFSDGKLANPMVIRIAGLAYQRGFGGHFHNDNSFAVFRDIPGLIVACPSNGEEAVKLLRECHRLAREEGRVVIFLEPIALYGAKDLHKDGDGAMSFAYPPLEERTPFGKVGVDGKGKDVAIISYANGAYLSRRAIKRLKTEHGIKARLIDIRWLKPLPIDAIVKAAKGAKHLLIVDECRATGSMSEELITGLMERGVTAPIARVTAKDSFIPLGPAAYTVLPSETDIIDAALNLTSAAPESAPQESAPQETNQ